MVFSPFVCRSIILNELTMGKFNDPQDYIYHMDELEDEYDVDINTEYLNTIKQGIEICKHRTPKAECKKCMSWKDWFINKLENFI